MFVHTIQYRQTTGTDGFGKPTYAGSPTAYKARVVQSPRSVKSRITGEDVIANTQVWVMGVITTLTVMDEITMPDGTIPEILSWSVYPDEDGNHHMKLYMNFNN